MAEEAHDRSPHGEQPGYGGNAEGVMGEQLERPGMGEKMRNTLAHVSTKVKGEKEEHASRPQGPKHQDDPLGYPAVNFGNGLKLKSEGDNAHHRRSLSPHSAHSSRSHSPRSPRVPYPEDEPIGVGEQCADSVMPGRYVDHPSNPNFNHSLPRTEKLLEKIPGYSQNPYKHYDHVSVGASADGHEHHHHPSPLRDPHRQHVVGEPGTEDVGEDHVERGEKRPGIIGKLKDLVTGQKPGQGTGTGYATTDQIAETKDEHPVDEKSGNQSDMHHMTQPYVTEPTPVAGGDRFRDAQAQKAWPSPAKPDYLNIPGAVRTDDQGKSIEGPKEEGKSPKSEGVMSKIMEKLHIGQQRSPSDQKATSPKTARGTTAVEHQ
ncbi:hypothetical protein R1flu_002961 [Riccia fluitans]|uniref:Uncharacterized protein n=1 Tax=Riccia fluitans TaxID=41844 RepID=A0ABD1Y7Z7_9MARC